jgi:glycine cleavage system H protein
MPVMPAMVGVNQGSHRATRDFTKGGDTMKEISELNLPDTVRYTKDHEYAQKQGDQIVIGIDDYAQDQLGEVVFVELPGVGDVIAKGDQFGTVESVKAVSEVYMPVSGTVIAVNTDLEGAPELVNNAPYAEGWMIRVTASDPAEYERLMDRAAYLNLLKG